MAASNAQTEAPKPFHGIIIGDPEVGKSSLLKAMSYGPLVTYYNSSLPWQFRLSGAEFFISEHHLKQPNCEGYFPMKPLNNYSPERVIESVIIHDVESLGGPMEDSRRHSFYNHNELCLLCFDISREISLQNAVEMWHPELVFRTPLTPVILVGCKSELRPVVSTGNNRRKYVTEVKGRSMAARIGAVGYIECSAKTLSNVEKLREIICWYACQQSKYRTTLQEERRASGQCVIA